MIISVSAYELNELEEGNKHSVGEETKLFSGTACGAGDQVDGHLLAKEISLQLPD